MHAILPRLRAPTFIHRRLARKEDVDDGDLQQPLA